MTAKMNYLRSNLCRFKLITFDVTDTLLEYAVRPERHYAQVINNMFRPRVDVSIDEQIVGESFVHCFRSMKSKYPNFGYTTMRPNQPNSGEENWRWWWRTLVERVILDAASRTSCNNIPATLLTKIANQLIDDYTFDAKGQCWKKRPGVDQILRALHETAEHGNTMQSRRPIIGVVSNFDPRLSTILRNKEVLSARSENGEMKMIDFVITSYEAGAEKPDPQIFHVALERANLESPTSHLKPHECLHIGNLCVEDYFGARSAGWHALLVNVPKKHLDQCTQIPSRYIFSGMPELQARLESYPAFEW